MRSTLEIDDDLMETARSIAARDKTTIGKVVTRLMREALAAKVQPITYRNGIPQMPVQPGAGRASLELATRLLDEEEADRVRIVPR